MSGWSIAAAPATHNWIKAPYNDDRLKIAFRPQHGTAHSRTSVHALAAASSVSMCLGATFTCSPPGPDPAAQRKSSAIGGSSVTIKRLYDGKLRSGETPALDSTIRLAAKGSTTQSQSRQTLLYTCTKSACACVLARIRKRDMSDRDDNSAEMKFC